MNGTASWNDHYDVVVVGSGTGLLGAITAARRGLRALVVEKGAYFGGSTAMSGGGLWMPNNRVLQEAGILDTKERVLTYLDNLVGDTAPRARRQAFVEHAPEVVDEILAATPLTLGHMPEYADYFADVEGGVGDRALRRVEAVRHQQHRSRGRGPHPHQRRRLRTGPDADHLQGLPRP